MSKLRVRKTKKVASTGRYFECKVYIEGITYTWVLHLRRWLYIDVVTQRITITARSGSRVAYHRVFPSIADAAEFANECEYLATLV